MKMEVQTTVKAAIAAIAAMLLSGGAALANGTPPTQYQCWNGWIKSNPADCPPLEVPKGTDISNSQVIDQIIENKLTANGGAGGAGGNADQKQSQGQGQSQTSTNSASTGPISIDNSTRIKQASAMAAPVMITGGTGAANCFGDVNPSGQFGASMQTFGWGVAASSSKASNVCAVAALAGPAPAIGYLQKMDPNVPSSITVMQPTGRLICPKGMTLRSNGRCR